MNFSYINHLLYGAVFLLCLLSSNALASSQVVNDEAPWAVRYAFDQTGKVTGGDRAGILEIVKNNHVTAFSYAFQEEGYGDEPAVVVAVMLYNGKPFTVIIHTMAEAIEVKEGIHASLPSVLNAVNFPTSYVQIEQAKETMEPDALKMPEGFAYSLDQGENGQLYNETYSSPEVLRNTTARDFEKISASTSVPQYVEVQTETVDGRLENESFLLLEAIPYEDDVSLSISGLSLEIAPFLVNSSPNHAIEAYLQRGYSIDASPEIITSLNIEPSLVK